MSINYYLKLNPFNRINQEESILFNFFRGLSAYAVLLSHLWQIIWDRNNSDHTSILYICAANAVMAFFVLSGYMITTSIYRNASEYQFKDFNLLHFAKDRLVRLYPPLVFSFLIVFLVYIAAKFFELNGRYELSSIDLWGSLAFLQDIFKGIPTPVMNNPLWSLSYEFWFYVIGSLLGLLIFKRSIKFLVLIGFIFIILYLFGNFRTFIPGFIIWLSGGLIAILHQNRSFERFKYIKLFYILLFLLILFYLFTFVYKGTYSQLLHSFSKYVFGIWFALLLCLSIMSKVTQRVKFGKNYVYNVIANSSAYSYTLYIIHWPLLLLFSGIGLSFNPSSILGKLITTFISAILIVLIAKKSANFTENKKEIFNALTKLKSLLQTNNLKQKTYEKSE